MKTSVFWYTQCLWPYVIHLHKTSLKSLFWLLKYYAQLQRETHPLYNNTKIIILSQSNWMNGELLACVELVCEKNASKV